MKKFSERNPVPIGIVGSIVLVVLTALALNFTKFPVLQGARTYQVAFADAAGLISGDAVRVGGLKVGQVYGMELDGARVVAKIAITDQDVQVGDESTFGIRTETLLGRRYLELVSRGRGEQDEDIVVPVARTSVPYTLTEVLDDLTTEVGQIDVNQLATALNTVSTTLEDTPDELAAALDGLKRLSQTISSRDAALQDLLGAAENVSGVLAERSDQLTKLVLDGNLLLAELERRREVIAQLLNNISFVTEQLTGLVRDNRRQLEPVLQDLNGVLKVLNQNKHNLDLILKRLPAFAGALGEAVASGPFFMGYVQNLTTPGNVFPTPLAPYPVPAGADTGTEPGDEPRGGN
jgi:phospholipid/cholesterol/gamma-HCH transport system substrate-binding protein